MNSLLKIFKNATATAEAAPKPTAADVQLMLMALSLGYMEDLAKAKEEKAQTKSERLEKLGFVSSKDCNFATMVKKLEYEMVCRYKRFFPDSIFLGVSDFKKVLEKYGLVCGKVFQYTGTVPDECLDLIERVKEIIDSTSEGFCHPNYESSIVTGYETSSAIKPIDVFKEYRHFPFVRTPLFPSLSLPNYTLQSLSRDTFLIAATPDKMVNTLAHVEKVVSSDPIVFQLIHHNTVMIHAKWGDEAEDPAFQNQAL